MMILNISSVIHVLSKLATYLWYLPRPQSRYKGAFPLYFERWFIKLTGTDKFLNLFSGNSSLGFTIDIKAENKPNVVADCHYLPLRDEIFENSIADPPYNDEFAKQLYNTAPLNTNRWIKEMVRVTKNKGLVCIMQNYPMARPKDCKYEFIVVILQRIKQYCKVVTGFRKENAR